MKNFISQTNKVLKKKKKRWTTKGRQVEEKILVQIEHLFSDKTLRRDELIEYLHILQDKFGFIYHKHLSALAEIMKIPMSEIYEVATFYAHFDINKDTEMPSNKTTIRVCESLTCDMFGSKKIFEDLLSKNDKNLNILHGPCMGRCQNAPTVCVGKNYVDNATSEKVLEVVERKDFLAHIPKYINYDEYIDKHGYETYKKIKNNRRFKFFYFVG